MSVVPERHVREFTDAADMKSITARYRLKRIRLLCRPGRWLDVGSADGRFVEAARGAGIDAVGVELSAVAVQAARERGVPVQQGSIADVDDGPYDTATAFDVIEHVPDPEGFLSHIAGVLPEGGTLVLTLPNLAARGLASAAVGGSTFPGAPTLLVPPDVALNSCPSRIRRSGNQTSGQADIAGIRPNAIQRIQSADLPVVEPGSQFAARQPPESTHPVPYR